MEKPESKWEGLSKGSDSLLSKKLAEGLVLSDTEHDLAMQIHKYSSQEPTANPEGVNYTEMNPPALSPTHGDQTPGLCLPFLPPLPNNLCSSMCALPSSQLGSLLILRYTHPHLTTP